jgi:hypothetical protein
MGMCVLKRVCLYVCVHARARARMCIIYSYILSEASTNSVIWGQFASKDLIMLMWYSRGGSGGGGGGFTETEFSCALLKERKWNRDTVRVRQSKIDRKRERERERYYCDLSSLQ